MISIREAAKNGFTKLYMKKWANSEDYLQIDILPDGNPGPWTHLYSPVNQEINGRNPVDLLCAFDYDDPIWEVKK